MKMTNKGGKNKKSKIKLFNKKKTFNIDDVISKLKSDYEKINPKDINKFSDFPLSFKTIKGLKESGYINPTDIQKESIGLALQGCDILGAAKTGSGKTLAFLIPVLEKLFIKKWTRLDGTGALIITPTRELAYQIFETLRKIGCYHDFSAGLIIGGKDLKFESKRMDQCNIVICTPGRLLHHMDQNALFDCVNLQILVLDEADRCLDLGFEQTMNSIIANLPPVRQTLLFSATQTKSVRDLARLSLKSPKYISVHENSSHSTPEGLTQSYMICELQDKVAMLWSFIKNHYKHKILVFLSSCKQVKYMFEIFCQLRPGIALLALYGSLHQQRRMDIYNSFCNKEHAVLFATDIASRGLDFPAVNWVIQLDCPEDATTYIHRVGRTARYHKGGEALLVMLPSEAEAMLANLAEKKIPISELKVNPKKLQNPRVKIEGMLARRPELKESAQRAFVSYVKSVFLMKDKNVFDVNKIDTDSYARSLGLVVSPRLRFLQKMQKIKNEQEKIKNNKLTANENKLAIKSEPESSDEGDKVRLNVKNKIKTDVLKLNKEIKSESESDDNDDSDNDKSEEDSDGNSSKLKVKQSKRLQTFNFGDEDSGSEDDILRIKRTDHALDDDDEDEKEILAALEEPGRRKKKPVTKAAIAKRVLKKNIVPNKKIVFSEDGQAIEDHFKQRVSEAGKKYDADEDGGGIDIEVAQQVLKEEDKIDKQLFKKRIKEKHREEKIKLKKLRKGEESENDEDGIEDEEGDDFESYSDNGTNYESGDGEVEASDYEEENYQTEDEHISRNLSKTSLKRKQEDHKEDNKRFKSIINSNSLIDDEELALQLLSGRN